MNTLWPLTKRDQTPAGTSIKMLQARKCVQGYDLAVLVAILTSISLHLINRIQVACGAGESGISNVDATHQAHAKLYGKKETNDRNSIAWKKCSAAFCFVVGKRYALTAFPGVILYVKKKDAPTPADTAAPGSVL